MVAQMVQTTQNRQPDWAKDDLDRLSRYAAARDFYDGAQWVGRAKKGERRITYNYARALTKKVASYVFPEGVTYSVSPKTRATEEKANEVERLLAETLRDLAADELDWSMCVESSVIGDAAVKVTWDPIAQKPLLGQVDPATLAVEYDPNLPSRTFKAIQRYSLPGFALKKSFGLTDYQVQYLSPYGLYSVEEEWTDATLRITVAGALVRNEANPYGWIPYVVLANDREPRHFWGTSDLQDLYDVCREFNARMTTLAQVMELSGAPIAVLENVDGSDGIAVRPGAKWEIPQDSKAYLLDLLAGGGVRLHIENLEQVRQTMHDLSETPRTAFGDSGKALSGAALEVEIQPLVQRVRRKRRSFERFSGERNRRLLDLLERFGGHDLAGYRLTVPVWPEIVPSDEDSVVRNIATLVSSGVQSRRTSAAQLGNIDPDRELQRVIEEMAMFSAAQPEPKEEGKPEDEREDRAAADASS